MTLQVCMIGNHDAIDIEELPEGPIVILTGNVDDVRDAGKLMFEYVEITAKEAREE